MNEHTATVTASAGKPADRIKLSAQLRALEERFHGKPMQLQDVFSITQGRGYYLLMLLFCLPFLTPIPTPMLSTVFGAAIFLTAARLTLGQRPWLPQRVLQKPLPSGFVSRLILAAARIVQWLETLLRPRLDFMHNNRVMDRVGAGLIAFAALMLMLPLPVPFSNFFPAGAILLLSAGALERDGLCSLAGWMMSAIAAAFMVGLAFGGVAVFDKLGKLFAQG
jgi:hypothetical protein